MANEIALTASLTAFKPSVMGSAVGRSVTTLVASMAGKYYAQGSVLVATTPTAVPLLSVTAPHWAWFYNVDPTNYLTIRNGVGGADLLQLQPLEQCPVPLLSTCVPYAVAHTAPCQMEYLIISA